MNLQSLLFKQSHSKIICKNIITKRLMLGEPDLTLKP